MEKRSKEARMGTFSRLTIQEKREGCADLDWSGAAKEEYRVLRIDLSDEARKAACRIGSAHTTRGSIVLRYEYAVRKEG